MDTSRGEVRFRVLGALEAYRDGEAVDPGPFKQRVLLGAMLCRSNSVLSVEQLMHVVWDERPPRTARKNLQVYISALRKIAGQRLRHLTYGYSLLITEDELDLLRFTNLVAAGRRAMHGGEPHIARKQLGEALRLWQDRPLVDLSANAFLAGESESIVERYLAAYEDWAELEIAENRYNEVVEGLIDLARQHPFRERLVSAVMTVLYRGGNQTEALSHYEDHRQLMAREFGLAPSPVLQRHYQDVLSGDLAGRAPEAAVTTLSGGRQPAQLPRDLPDFVGRDTEIAELEAVLTRPGSGVALIAGSPGVGKTALAVHVGHRIANRFPDGQVFAVLRDQAGIPRPRLDVLHDLLRSTGLHVTPPDDEDAAVGLWRSWLADRRFLLVFDDAPDEAAVRGLLPGCAGSGVIVTGYRMMVGLDGIHRCRLGELAEDEAHTLLANGLGAARVSSDYPAAGRLVALSGGLPLAIRAVSARLNLRRELSLASYAARLTGPGDILREFAEGDRSVRARMERYCVGLPPHSREALRVLGRLPRANASLDEVVAALSMQLAPDRALEEMLDIGAIAPADSEVVAHQVGYVLPLLLHRFARELGEPRNSSSSGSTVS
jgi:DNA-binding SARP family transcriptional activator